MEFIQITDDKLVNAETIVSVEKRKNSFSITTVDGKQHLVEKDLKYVFGALGKAGVSIPQQFWAG